MSAEELIVALGLCSRRAAFEALDSSSDGEDLAAVRSSSREEESALVLEEDSSLESARAPRNRPREGQRGDIRTKILMN